MTTLLTKNHAMLTTEVQKHIAADAVIQGEYWTGSKGCFIGCLTHSSDGDATILQDRFGLPLPLVRICEGIFESLPAAESKAFFAALPDAVARDGKDLSRVHWQFLAAELRALPEVPEDIQAVIDPIIAGMDLLAVGEDWTGADAAYADAAALIAPGAAADAAVYAAYAADAYAAARAAYAAFYAAYAADAYAAARAADDAFYAAYAADAYAAARAADDADAYAHAAYAARAARAAARAARAARAAARAADDADDADAYADAADAARLRQRDTLLALIAAA